MSEFLREEDKTIIDKIEKEDKYIENAILKKGKEYAELLESGNLKKIKKERIWGRDEISMLNVTLPYIQYKTSEQIKLGNLIDYIIKYNIDGYIIKEDENYFIECFDGNRIEYKYAISKL